MGPAVIIKLKPYLIKFLKSSFGNSPLLDSKNPLSSTIYSRLEVPDYKEENDDTHQEQDKNTIVLRLGTCHGINIFKYRYINPDRFPEIEKAIAELVYWPMFYTYVLSYLDRNETEDIKSAINCFINEYDLVDEMDYETFKKRFYRFRHHFVPRKLPKSPGRQTSLFDECN